jgi:hypothetical protein
LRASAPMQSRGCRWRRRGPEQYVPKRYYVFVLRDSIARHWASPDAENAPESQSPTAEVGEAVFEEAAAADIQAAAIKEGTGERDLGYALPPQIRAVAVQIYDEAEKAGRKPPNITEAFHLVKERLAPKRAPKTRVFPVLQEEDFKNRRWTEGQRSPKK